MLDVAEVLRHRQAGERDAQSRARRLVHLAEHQCGLVEDPGLAHLLDEVVALAGALADAGEHGDAAVVLGDALDHLLDEHGLAHARAAEEADLPALHVGGEQVDDLDARLEHLRAGFELVEGRGLAVDGPPLLDLQGLPLLEVEDIAGDVEDVALGHIADGDRDRRSRVGDLRAAHEPVGRFEGDGADEVPAQVLGDLEGHREGALVLALAGEIHIDQQGVVQRRDAIGRELDVDHGADDSGDAPFRDGGFLCHGCSPCRKGLSPRSMRRPRPRSP